MQTTGKALSNSPSKGEDIAAPGTIDYIKVRAYLYKFTPTIFYGGGEGQANLGNNLAVNSVAQGLVNQITNLITTLKKNLAEIQGINLTASNTDPLWQYKSPATTGV